MRSGSDYVQASAAQFNAKQLSQASEAYSYLKTLKPGDSQVKAKSLFSAARVLLAEGKAKEAVTLLEKAMALDPRTACSWNALGVAYEKTNDIEKAMNFYKRAAQLAPGWSLPHHKLGLQYYARGKSKDALREFKSAKDLDPAFLHARWWMVHAYSEQGRYGEAEHEAKELIALAPNYGPAYAELGLIYQASRRYEDATEVFNKYLQLSLNNAASNAAGNRTTPESQQAQERPAQPKGN